MLLMAWALVKVVQTVNAGLIRKADRADAFSVAEAYAPAPWAAWEWVGLVLVEPVGPWG